MCLANTQVHMHTPFGHLTFNRMFLHFMTQQLMIKVAGYTGLIHCKHLHGILHTVK